MVRTRKNNISIKTSKIIGECRLYGNLHTEDKALHKALSYQPHEE